MGGSTTTGYNQGYSNIILWQLLFCVQFGPGWTTSVQNNFGIQLSLCNEFTNSRKRKNNQDSAHKISLKYKKRLVTRYGHQSVSPDPSNPAEPDIPADELKKLCQKYLTCLQVATKSSILNFITVHHH